MLELEKLFTGVLLSGTLPKKRHLVEDLLSGLAAVVGLAITIAILSGALLIGGLVWGYNMLVEGGLSQNTASLIVAATILAMISGISYVLYNRIQKLKSVPQQFVETESPFIYKITSAANSFTDGLLKRKTTIIRR